MKNLELEDALKIYIEKIQEQVKPIQAEDVMVKDSFGRITAEAVYAKISSPHYNACAMDGIAVAAKKTFGASETTPVTLFEGVDFVRVDTGDPLYVNYDSVVMIEEVIEQGSGKIKLLNSVTPWQHVRQIGEDICFGEMIITCNTRIEPSMIGAMLAGGVLKIKVWKKPVVGLIPTGDEIISSSGEPKEGEIIEFNSSIFSAILGSWGAIPKVYDIIPDKFELIKCGVQKACNECDLVILNAGSSAGREDYSSVAIAEAGEVFVHGIAIRPGKPTILGIVNHRPVIGVPGYPVSGIIVMEMIVKEVLEKLKAIRNTDSPNVKAILAKKLMSSLKYKEFVRVKLGRVGERLIATPLNRGAGVVTSFVKADGILEIPLNTEGIDTGSEVRVSLLRSEEEIRNTLVLIGSHDPLIDVIADIIRRDNQGEYLSSAHVGSLGGLMAIKRGEAHIAGIHLLDEMTGEYNISYVEKYLGNQKNYLIKGVKRSQGLMIKQGNPKGIKSLKCICTKESDSMNIKYVNRQKGSGTRILLDYLLKKENISFKAIYGYEREEFTHMSVAALVASESADVGMGIYSAANAYGLDFIPVCEEQYDFIVPEQFIEHNGIKRLLEILRSREFSARLALLGGYKTQAAGEISLV